MTTTYPAGAPGPARETHEIYQDGDDASAAILNPPLQSLIDTQRYLLPLQASTWHSAEATASGVAGDKVGDVAFGADTSGVPCYVAAGDEVGGGNSTRWLSYDGVNWSGATLSVSDRIRGVAYDSSADKWVIVGHADATDGLILSTSDPAGTWTEQGNAQPADLHSVAASDAGLFVAVGAVAGGQAYILSSTDGTTWTPRTGVSGAFAMNDVAFASSLWVAVGGSGSSAKIQTSADGITWTDRTNPGGKAIRRIAWNGSVFVTLGDDGEIMTSADGITWAVRTGIGTGTNGNTAGCAADPASGVIIAHGAAVDGAFVSYDDGVTFTGVGVIGSASGSAPLMPDSIRHGGGRFIATCDYANISSTPRV